MVSVSSGMRYLPVSADKDLYSKFLEKDMIDRQESTLRLYKRFYDEQPKESSPLKPVLGSPINAPDSPIPKYGELHTPITGLPPQRIDYPDAPIFPTEPGLNSPDGDWGYAESRQLAMNAGRVLTAKYWKDRFEPNPRPSGF